MAELGEHCPLLKEIVLSHCRQITDVGLAHLVKGCCTVLESCHMVYCSGVTSVGVATVVSSCPNIKSRLSHLLLVHGPLDLLRCICTPPSFFFLHLNINKATTS